MHNQDGTEYGRHHRRHEAFLYSDNYDLIADRAGIDQEQIITDPGIGFGKTFEQNVYVKHLRDLTSLPYPMLLGTSRRASSEKSSIFPSPGTIRKERGRPV